jgi:hypothetical protein
MNMNRRLRTILVLALAATTIPAMAGEGSQPEQLSIGVFAGPSIPGEAVEHVYNTLDTSGIANAYDAASSLGYHLGARLRFGLADALSFSGGVQFTQFPGQTQTATLDNGSTLELKTVTNYIPVYAGITILPFRSLVTPYVSAELMYAYRSVTISEGNSIFEELITGTGQELEPTTSTFGAALAAGVELNLGGLRPFVDLRYNWTNLVGREEGDPQQTFLNVSVGLFF